MTLINVNNHLSKVLIIVFGTSSYWQPSYSHSICPQACISYNTTYRCLLILITVCFAFSTQVGERRVDWLGLLLDFTTRMSQANVLATHSYLWKAWVGPETIGRLCIGDGFCLIGTLWMTQFLKWQPCHFPVMALCFVVLIYLNVFQ